VTRFILKRTGACAAQLILITGFTWTVFFLVASLTGATPAERVAGKAASADQIRQVAHQLGTDRPYYVQYGRFLWHFVQGDFGYSYQQRVSVTEITLPAAATTASLVLGAAVLWMLAAIPAGVVAAVRHRRWGDRALMTLAFLGISLPVFWLAPMISYALGYEPTQGRLFGIPIGTSLHIFPIDGYVSLQQDPLEWAHHLLLPWLTLAIGFAAIYARYCRALVLEQFSESYVRTARAKGAGERTILASHIAPNVAPLIVTLLALDAGTALGGAVFVETVFGLPGLGFVTLSSIQNLDYPLTVGVITFTAMIAVVANALGDLVHVWLDPRVRVEGGDA
jgi:peptide/nickel transport system permease protein